MSRRPDGYRRADYSSDSRNSRRPRAGSAFEEIIRGLFRQCKYPFDEKATINGTPDFVMPSAKHFGDHATDCIIFTMKRTLRERWRQIVTEGAKGATFFLATLDDSVSANSLRNMREQKIHLVVAADLKSGIDHCKSAPNVTSFEGFFEDYLDPAVARWKRRGVIW